MATRIQARERMEIEKIFKSDFMAIDKAMMEQLSKHYGSTRELVLEELGIDEATGEAKRLEDEIASKKLELQRLRERLTREIYLAEQRLELLKTEALGKYTAPPEPEQLQELGFGHDDPIDKRNWYGFPVKCKLDALVCLKMKKIADIATPLEAIRKIYESVQRELAFAATFEQVEAVYEKFYSLNFWQYGVDIPPRLDDLKKLKGAKLLSMSVDERNPPKQLTDGKKGRK